MTADYVVTVVVLVGVFLGLSFAAYYAYVVSLIPIIVDDNRGDARRPLSADSASVHGDEVDWNKIRAEVLEISTAISEGANAFLYKEYYVLAWFILGFGTILLILLGFLHGWTAAAFSLIAFVVGAITSIASGFIGMRIAVFSNSRTALSATHSYQAAFTTSFKAGCVMGFALVSLALVVLFILVNLFSLHYTDILTNPLSSATMYECLSGYGLGGSSVALFGRVGGGIYTKAADVGADLVGKVEKDLPEDDPRNPAVIADNVGDNVGDIAGMGADLFGSFAESACAAMVIAAQSTELHQSWAALCFPLVLAAVGIMVCFVTSFFATHIIPVTNQDGIEPALKRQILVSTLLMTPAAYIVCYYFLPSGSFTIGDKVVEWWHIFICVLTGLWSGMVIGYITEYYTSHAYSPVREVAQSCETGAATNIIYGLALGYKSVIIPTVAMAVTIYVSYSLAGMFGIASAALGILSPLAIDLTIDAYGPICDNAGGIAEMAHMPPEVREKTDALDGAGNTTAAIGKGFAIGSAAFVSLALFGAFVTTKGLKTVDILQPFQFAGLLVGAMLPYWFSAMTMKSVGFAAKEMVVEVRRQFNENKAIMDPNSGVKPDYKRCVAISTEASLKEMLPPGALVMLTPLLVGFLFGVNMLAGVLAGALVSGVQMAISSSNTGGAWDNAKKFIAAGGLGPDKKKHSEEHKAAVIGDTVGDPLKDTSGPSLNILIKLMAIISLVFAPAFPTKGYLEQLFTET